MTEPYSNEPVTKMDEVFPQHTNAYNTLFGGRLLSIMDTAAGMASSKFAHREFVTISVDALKFKRPAYQGDLIETTAKVVHTSTHTAGVYVVAKRLNRSEWEREEICAGFLWSQLIHKCVQSQSLNLSLKQKKINYSGIERKLLEMQ